MRTVSRALERLRKTYGSGTFLEPSDPFALIVWENCAYLVDDQRRAHAFNALASEVGMTPTALVSAGTSRIESAIAEGGMQPTRRAEKVLRCAEIALEHADGDLASTLKSLDSRRRRTLLKRFPGIGEPGADKVLLLCGLEQSPALDSNGLRVLERLGFIDPSPSYASSYRAGVAFVRSQRLDPLAAFTLLREHGRELCKRTTPYCYRCPLRDNCPSASRYSRSIS